MTSDPWEYRCGTCGAGLMPTVSNPAPEFCDSVCEAGRVMRRARAAVRAEVRATRPRGRFRSWWAERMAWWAR